MAGRNPTAAVKAFVEPIREALGLFASGKVTADAYKPREDGVLTFNDGDVVRLRGQNKVGFRMTMRYVIIPTVEPERGPWKVTTTGYMYDLFQDERTLYEYHWHPISASHEVRPHLHCAAVGKAHIPTGRIMIEDVLNLAVNLGAEPADEDRWTALDQLNREKFARGATWGVGPS